MKRRAFIAGLAGVAVWPVVARAQQTTQAGRPLVAMLLLSQASVSRFITPFSDRMQELGWIESRDYDTVYRYSGGNVALMQSLASELVELDPAVIFASTALAARVSRQITSTVPIVCPSLVDPIESGLAESYARPGRNVTGIVYQVDDLQSKLFELAIEAVPGARKVGTLTTVASSQNMRFRRDNEATAAKLLNVTPLPIAIEGPADIDAAFDNFVRENVQVVIVYVDAVLFANRGRVADLALQRKLPTIFGYREHVDAGGLISYGVDVLDNWRRAGTLVDKILKGTNPGDLPIEFPTKLEMVINLKTAKALGLTIPPTLLARADEVIE